MGKSCYSILQNGGMIFELPSLKFKQVAVLDFKLN